MSVWSDSSCHSQLHIGHIIGCMFWKTKLERNLKYKGHSEKNDIDVWNDGIGKKSRYGILVRCKVTCILWYDFENRSSA